MKDLIPFVALGVAAGSLYGLAAVGLVLTYRTSGIFNFAQGVVAAVGAYTFYELRELNGVPWPVALIATLGVVAPALGLLLERVAARLHDVSVAGRIVATVGVLIGLQGLLTIRYGAAPISVEPFLSQRPVHLGPVTIGVDQIIVIAVAATAALALTAILHRTRLGLSMQAVVEAPELVDLYGMSPRRVRAWSWVLGSTFAALSGILLAPTLGLDVTLLTLLVVQAFGAAALGRFRSIPATYAGGLCVGVVAALCTKYLVDVPELAGLPASVPFLALVAVLITARPGTLPETLPDGLDSGAPPVPALRNQVGIAAVAFVVLAALPLISANRTFTFTVFVVQILVLASLRLLVRTSGQVSLCHLTFVAVGATTFSHLASGAGAPWAAALVGAGALTAVVGFVVSLPAMRLGRLYVALTTFGFALLMERLVFPLGVSFGAGGIRSAPRPDVDLLSSDRGYYYLVLAVVAVAVTSIVLLERARLGRLLRGLADSPLSLRSSGLSVDTTRTLAFCAATFLAGIAGALLIGLSGSVSSNGFGVFASLTVLVVLYISGTDAVLAPVVGAAASTLIPSYVTSASINEILQVVFGFSAVIAVAFRPKLTGRSAAGNVVADWSKLPPSRAPITPPRTPMRKNAAWTA